MSSLTATQRFGNVQDALTYFEMIPVAGAIASALRIIVSLGELIASRLFNDENLRSQAWKGLAQGTINFFSGGLLIPIGTLCSGWPPSFTKA